MHCNIFQLSPWKPTDIPDPIISNRHSRNSLFFLKSNPVICFITSLLGPGWLAWMDMGWEEWVRKTAGKISSVQCCLGLKSPKGTYLFSFVHFYRIPCHPFKLHCFYFIIFLSFFENPPSFLLNLGFLLVYEIPVLVLFLFFPPTWASFLCKHVFYSPSHSSFLSVFF